MTKELQEKEAETVRTIETEESAVNPALAERLATILSHETEDAVRRFVAGLA